MLVMSCSRTMVKVIGNRLFNIIVCEGSLNLCLKVYIKKQKISVFKLLLISDWFLRRKQTNFIFGYARVIFMLSHEEIRRNYCIRLTFGLCRKKTFLCFTIICFEDTLSTSTHIYSPFSESNGITRSFRTSYVVIDK